MGASEIITAVLQLAAGIGIFLIACSMMSGNLESLSSEKLKSMFSRAAKSKLLGVGIGTVGTAAIQSSGATTVMLIGFVNAGIMSLEQAATVVYGANIGTTITGQIVALGMFGGSAVSTTVIFSALTGLGAFMITFAKSDLYKKIGGILAGFGALFVGLGMMSGSMESFANLAAVKSFLAGIENAFLLVFIGALLTAVVQSSSVITSVAIAMVVTGLISLNQGIFITMGSNIGSCVVAVIAGMTSGRNAKRTALIHLIFNVTGVVIFLIVGEIMGLLTGGGLTYGTIFAGLFPSAPQTQLAMFHTVFNIITVILVLPLTNVLVSLVRKIIPDKADEKPAGDLQRFYYIDEHLLKTPAVAIQQMKNEIVNMAGIAMANFTAALKIIGTLDFSGKEQFEKNENELNFLNREIVSFAVKLSELPLSERDRLFLSTTFHSVSDLERVGDYSENIVEYAQNIKEHGEGFSEEAKAEIEALLELIEELFSNVIQAYAATDFAALDRANEIEEKIDLETARMAENHIKRLNDRICTPNEGAQYLSLTSDSERVADHFINVAKTIKSFA